MAYKAAGWVWCLLMLSWSRRILPVWDWGKSFYKRHIPKSSLLFLFGRGLPSISQKSLKRAFPLMEIEKMVYAERMAD